jgi:hypothetical protein
MGQDVNLRITLVQSMHWHLTSCPMSSDVTMSLTLHVTEDFQYGIINHLNMRTIQQLIPACVSQPFCKPKILHLQNTNVELRR